MITIDFRHTNQRTIQTIKCFLKKIFENSIEDEEKIKKIKKVKKLK
jgi:hypothetical protein